MVCLAFFHCLKFRYNLYIPSCTDLKYSDEWALQFYILTVTPKGKWYRTFPPWQKFPLAPLQTIPPACFPREATTSDFCIACFGLQINGIAPYVFFCVCFFWSLHIFKIHPSSCVILFICIQSHEHTTICLLYWWWLAVWAVRHYVAMSILEYVILGTCLHLSWENV